MEKRTINGSEKMLEIVDHTHGEICNRHSGKETSRGLLLPVTGIARPGDIVTVNGLPAERRGEAFHAEVLLASRKEKISVHAEGNRGTGDREVWVIYYRDSFRRINFCIDDNIYTFSDIAKERPGSIFDHFYFRKLRKLHERFDLRLTVNLFWEDMRSGFTLADFPDCYKAEFQDNSAWMKLAFHARAEFPDRIYQNAEVKTLLRDYDAVGEQIIRFAGAETLTAPQNIHWSMVKPGALPELRKRGVLFLGGLFFDGQTRIGEAESAQTACDAGYFENEENALFIRQNKVWHDFRCDITMGIENIVLNLEPMPALKKKLAALFADRKNETLHMLTHEQYSYSSYREYLPDHFDRMALMAETAREAGYRFVSFSEGFLGNIN